MLTTTDAPIIAQTAPHRLSAGTPTERRICTDHDCGAPVREERASWNRAVLQLRCERVFSHAGHRQAACSHGDAA